MTLIDTHAHLYIEEFEEDRAEMIARAKAEGVERFYLPSIDSKYIEPILALEAAYPDECFAMPGLHPCYVKEDFEKELTYVKNLLEQPRKWCAIGEIGLDLYWDKTFFEQQKEAFIQQIRWAKAYNLPIVIHTREATDEALDIVESEKTSELRGIFHCFGGSLEQAQRIMDLDFLMGIGGVLTFKKSGLDVTCTQIPIEYFVLETDAPYLAPVPYRGKRNESAYLKFIAQKLAEVKGISVEEVAKITSENALNLFAI